MDGHGLQHQHVLLPGQRAHLRQLPAVEGDGLFAQHVFASLNGGLHPVVVGIVRAGDVDHVQIRITHQGVRRGMYTPDAVFSGQFLRRLFPPAGNGLDAAIDRLQRGRHATRCCTCAQNAPAPVSVAHVQYPPDAMSAGVTALPGQGIRPAPPEQPTQ